MKRRLRTRVLLVVNLALLVAIAWTLGAPITPQWLAAAPVPDPKAPTPPVPSPQLSQALLAETWAHPLFAPDRQPDLSVPGEQVPVLSGLTLTGVVLSAGAKLAYLREGAQPAHKVELGATLGSGWTLSHLTATTATFTRNAQTYTLSLPVPRLPAPSKASVITPPRTSSP
ncbi:general secretion pathway protein GspN [Pseudomonas putida]|nr:general secretion pathway protein GspN [Pseudomonas putida]